MNDSIPEKSKFGRALRNLEMGPQLGRVTDTNGDAYEIIVADKYYFTQLIKAAIQTEYSPTDAELALMARLD